VDDHASPKPARLSRRKQALEIALSETPDKTSGDEDRLALVRHAALRELRDRCGKRVLPRIARGSRKRKCGRLDDDCRSAATTYEGTQGLARQWVSQRVSYRRGGINEVCRRRGRANDDVLVVDRNDDDPRA
jgi:hypothetical protein